MLASLVSFFRGIHLAFGMTAIPENATLEQEKKFVLMWFGIIAVMIAWCALLVYLLV